MNATARPENAGRPTTPERKQRTNAIREQLKKYQKVRYFYFLLEPDEDVIRYVGCCADPVQRFLAHIGNGAAPQVKAWVHSLGGRLPRMEVVGTVGHYGPWMNEAATLAYFGEVLESDLIRRIRAGKFVGNRKMVGKLLNVL